MKYRKALFPIAFLIFIGPFANAVFCSEINGWVKSETCWVVKEPSKEAKIMVHPEFAYFMMLETGRFRIIFVWKSTYPTRRKVLCPQAFCTMVSVFEVINT